MRADPPGRASHPSRKGPTQPMGLAPHTRTRLAAALLAAPLLAASSGLLLATSAGAQSAGAVKALSTNKFDPATLTVPAGTKVTWTSEGGFHTVTGGDGAKDPASPIGNHTLADASATVEVTFDKPGTYKYFCQPHASLGMKGEIVVTAGGGAGPASPAASAPAASASATAAVATPDPGGASESAGPGEQNVEDSEGTGIPGSTAEDNPTLKEIEEERAADENKLSGFNSLVAAGTLALLALCVAVFASTRPRRPSK